MVFKSYKLLAIGFACFLFCSGCKKFLDARPDKSLTVPRTVSDLQKLMDAQSLTESYPVAGAIACDDYYVTYSAWAAFSNLTDRNDYIWDPQAINDDDWRNAYERIFYANVALDQLPSVNDDGQSARNNVQGSALFIRADNYYQLAQVFTPPFNKATAATELGLPLHLSSDINEPTVRSSVLQTYQRIIADCRQSVDLLPAVPASKTRPSQSAAYALLARTYLVMGQYDSSFKYADLSLQQYKKLIDYNNVNAGASLPFAFLNDEVVYHTLLRSVTILRPANAIIDSALINSYDANDLRKSILFTKNADGTYRFKGTYYGLATNVVFSGVSTAEMYLVRAESNARLGRVAQALDDLNLLLLNRYKTGSFSPLTAGNVSEALSEILQERRKEMVFRGASRWADLRRLNNETQFAKNVVRILNGQQYVLAPADPRYAFLLPESVVNITGVQQNKR